MASISDPSSLRTISTSNSSSLHGRNSLLQEDSTLHSPVQSQHEPPVQEQDIPANVEHVEYGNETQPSLSSFRTPSNPSSIREEKYPRFTFLRRATHWKTVGMIIGFLFVGQSNYARGRMPLTLHSSSFRLRALPVVQELGRQAYRHKLSYATPDLRNFYPVDYHIQSSINSKSWNLFRATHLVYSAWGCYLAISD
jgi:hypothetical protein